MKKFILFHVSALLILSACQPNSEFSKKKSQASSFDISVPGSDNINPIGDSDSNAGSCTEITSYMMCLSSTSCEPVLQTNLAEIPAGQEEALFAKCIPKLPADMPGMPGSDTPDGDGPVVVVPPKDPGTGGPIVVVPPKNNDVDEPYVGTPPKEPETGGPIVVVPPKDNPTSGIKPPRDPETGEPIVIVPPKMPGDGPIAGNPPTKGPGKNKGEDGPMCNLPPMGPGKGGSVASNPPTKGPGKGEPVDAEVPGSEVPSLPTSCAGIEAKHLTEKGKKVMICHNSANKRHTIIIACPALKAHIGHHEDVLGSCKEE